MKEIRFETSKGKFIAIKRESNAFDVCMWSYKYELIDSLKEITEEQCKDIISFTELILNFNNGKPKYCTFKESLHLLLKSKGIHLYKNPYDDKIGITDFDYHRNRSEQKTFYNPYIFKINE